MFFVYRELEIQELGSLVQTNFVFNVWIAMIRYCVLVGLFSGAFDN